MKPKGVAFPMDQPMRLFSSIYNADQWATRGGLIKTDWSFSPFTASYRNFNAGSACVLSPNRRSSSCSSSTAWLRDGLHPKEVKKMKGVQKRFRIYDYCVDGKRFPSGLPPECGAL
ncbi:hypothetical protein CRG98_019722 [Punica granatum]|nr:hypothetical protein CRG98_019722 [Punica granatum]